MDFKLPPFINDRRPLPKVLLTYVNEEGLIRVEADGRDIELVVTTDLEQKVVVIKSGDGINLFNTVGQVDGNGGE